MGETPQATTEQPSVIFSPVDHWESLSDEEEAIWRKELRQYGVISSCEILNVAPLSFLRTFGKRRNSNWMKRR